MVKIQENDILKVFARMPNATFGDIRKALKLRSNKLAYHLNKLVEDGALSKIESRYALSDAREQLVPYLSSELAAIPVVLVHIGDSKKVVLVKREKRPYKDMLGMPGGRLRVGESVFDAARRIAKARCGLDVVPVRIAAMEQEHVVTKSDKVVHSFILILVHATVAKRIKNDLLFDVSKFKTKIIQSDYALITAKRSSNIELPVVRTQLEHKLK